MAFFVQVLLFLLLIFMSLFLILIVLIQRGKGGGLVGAFGGLGGSSAFGAKSTDVFVKITVITVIIWFAFCIVGRHILDIKTTDEAPYKEDVKVNAPLIPGADANAPAPAADAKAPATDAKAPAAAPAPKAETKAPADASKAPASKEPAKNSAPAK